MEADTSPCRCNPVKDGGPAFPVPELNCWDGMSLRDAFAAVALLGEYLREASGQTNACGPYSGRSTAAYRQADSMLEERDKKP